MYTIIKLRMHYTPFSWIVMGKFMNSQTTISSSYQWIIYWEIAERCASQVREAQNSAWTFLIYATCDWFSFIINCVALMVWTTSKANPNLHVNLKILLADVHRLYPSHFLVPTHTHRKDCACQFVQSTSYMHTRYSNRWIFQQYLNQYPVSHSVTQAFLRTLFSLPAIIFQLSSNCNNLWLCCIGCWEQPWRCSLNRAVYVAISQLLNAHRALYGVQVLHGHKWSCFIPVIHRDLFIFIQLYHRSWCFTYPCIRLLVSPFERNDLAPSEWFVLSFLCHRSYCCSYE